MIVRRSVPIAVLLEDKTRRIAGEYPFRTCRHSHEMGGWCGINNEQRSRSTFNLSTNIKTHNAHQNIPSISCKPSTVLSRHRSTRAADTAVAAVAVQVLTFAQLLDLPLGGCSNQGQTSKGIGKANSSLAMLTVDACEAELRVVGLTLQYQCFGVCHHRND